MTVQGLHFSYLDPSDCAGVAIILHFSSYWSRIICSHPYGTQWYAGVPIIHNFRSHWVWRVCNNPFRPKGLCRGCIPSPLKISDWAVFAIILSVRVLQSSTALNQIDFREFAVIPSDHSDYSGAAFLLLFRSWWPCRGLWRFLVITLDQSSCVGVAFS